MERGAPYHATMIHLRFSFRCPLVAAAALIATIAAACASVRRTDDVPPSRPLERTRGVLIARPNDASYSTSTYAISGNAAAHALQRAFATHAASAMVINDCRDETCLRQRQEAGNSYLVIPTLVAWEDRRSRLTPNSDRVDLKLRILGPGGTQATTTLVISGAWTTTGTDRPEDLLIEPIRAYVEGLYRRPQP